MKEYIIFYGNNYMHFYVAREGLCVRKMENGRFLNSNILLPDAKFDFSAVSLGGLIHIVCQSNAGEILYITYDGKVWEKAVLLKGKEKSAYTKHFSLVPIGNFINLFYTINHENKTMLIHQILDGMHNTPEVIDYITPRGEYYFASPNITSDVTLCYQNAKGELGTKLYRWSQKSFMPFFAIEKEENIYSPFLKMTSDGFLMTAILKEKNGDSSILFYTKNEIGEIKKIKISKECDKDSMPIIFINKERIYIEWFFRGLVYSVCSYDEGMSFSKPLSYVKKESAENKLFLIDNSKEITYCYGARSKSEIVFYSSSNVLEEKKSEIGKKHKAKTSGEDAEEFAKRAGFVKSGGWEDDPYVTQRELKTEIEKLKSAVDGYKKIIAELNRKIQEEESPEKHF